MLITQFSNSFAFLSNFYPCKIRYEGIEYPSVEHAYQAAKTWNKKDRLIISQLDTPGQAKRYGASVKIRDFWEKDKVSTMLELIRLKFNNPELERKLLETYPHELIEGSPYEDITWGAVDQSGIWIGKNYLGKILMEVRNEKRLSAINKSNKSP